MKTVFSFLALVASAMAAPTTPVTARTFGLFNNEQCGIKNTLLDPAYIDLKLSRGQTFCSAYLQQTSIVTSTQFVVTTVSETSTNVATQTVTTTVPTPTGVCGLSGYGAGTSNTFFNGDGSFTQATCQTKCAEISATSYGYGLQPENGLSFCGCYSTKVADFVAPDATSPYKFYDITCPQPASVTVAPRAGSACIPDSAKQPPFLVAKKNYDPARISSACACLIANIPAAPCTVTTSAILTFATTYVDVVQATTTVNV